ncbi:MAG: hypothetical protein ACLP19_05220 [Xanthobacteraceae bacterium]
MLEVRGNATIHPHMKRRISRRALLLRINGKLKDRGRTLKTARPYERETLGEFYLVDEKRIIETHIDIEEFGAKEGVLQPWETIS